MVHNQVCKGFFRQLELQSVTATDVKELLKTYSSNFFILNTQDRTTGEFSTEKVMAENTENVVDVIDLTDSFISGSNIVIDLDESCNSPDVSEKKVKRNKSTKHLLRKDDKQNQENSSKLLKDYNQQRKDSNGECPICWEDLRSNPLASTKCGHVYCYKCLQEALRVEKKCPTCRCALKKASDYHPIYLP